MTEEAVHPLLGAATNLEFDTMAQLVKAGQRCYDAFLRDQGYTLSNDNPDYAEFLALASERCGLPVENESQLLFEIYETLLLAGHPLPCDGTRRCMVRVIAGADASRHTRATILMGLCLDQGLLDWRNSQWAIDIEQQAGAKLMTPLSRPDELFADAFGEAAQAGNLPLLQRLAGSLPEDLNARRKMLTSTQSAAAKCMRGGNTACLDYLLTLMPEPMWRRTASMGSNPLTIVAAQTGQEELLRWLVVDKGMDINELDAHQSRMVPILLALGADPNTCQKGHPNPLNMRSSQVGILPHALVDFALGPPPAGS